MAMATYQRALHRLQPVIPFLFDSLQEALTETAEDHERKKLKRRTDPHYFAHGVRRLYSERLKAKGLLVTDVDHDRSTLPMSGIRIDHDGLSVWMFRSEKQIPLPASSRKQEFYSQTSTLEGWDNLLLLWSDLNYVLRDPMHLVRPLGGDNRRANLRIDWGGPLARSMATMRAADLDELQPEQMWTRLDDTGA
jgi:hypothetical protein